MPSAAIFLGGLSGDYLIQVFYNFVEISRASSPNSRYANFLHVAGGSAKKVRKLTGSSMEHSTFARIENDRNTLANTE